MAGNELYDFNFFKPTSRFARDNSKLITSIILSWAVAVFGFHFLLKAIEKPVPEENYIVYKQIWPKVTNKTATPEERQLLSRVYLNLLGRYISLRSNQALKLAFTATAYDLLPEAEQPAFIALTRKDISAVKSKTTALATALGLSNDDILNQVLPYGITPYDGKPLSSEMLSSIPKIMSNHLIHNQSILTDTKFLGFPFHYFYTAVLLLTLFVGLCLIYCKVFDRIAESHGMETEEVPS